MAPTSEELIKVAQWLRLHAIEHAQPLPLPDRCALSSVGSWLDDEVARQQGPRTVDDDQYGTPG